jgi:O-antigen/teichoic acid export membrane protein
VAGQQLLHSADVVVLGLMASASAVGLYSIAVPIAGMIWVFSEALSLIAFDSGSRSTSAAQQRAQRSKLTRLNFIVGFLACIVIGLGSIIFVPLLLPEYAAAVPLILILLPGVLIQGYARIGLSSILTAGSKRSLVLIGLSSALLCVLYIPFVEALGATGAAIASSVIYSLQTVVVFVVIKKRMKNLELKEAYVVE